MGFRVRLQYPNPKSRPLALPTADLENGMHPSGKSHEAPLGDYHPYRIAISDYHAWFPRAQNRSLGEEKALHFASPLYSHLGTDFPSFFRPLNCLSDSMQRSTYL